MIDVVEQVIERHPEVKMRGSLRPLTETPAKNSGVKMGGPLRPCAYKYLGNISVRCELVHTKSKILKGSSRVLG
jgi:hypothetical protein